MMPNGYIEMLQRQGMSDELLQYNIVKEYLLDEISNLYKEINSTDDNINLPLHIKNNYIHTLEERKSHLNHLKDKVLYKIKENESKT